MGWSQTYCVVCAGPAENPINERYSEWLNSHVGITYDNNPKRIFGYDGLCFYKAQDERHLTLQGQDEDYDMSFWAFDTQECQLTYDTICDFEEDHRGVTCHTACYELLESSLNYRLQLHDIWPLVMRNPAGYGARVEEDYGGMVKYHCQEILHKEMRKDGNLWMLSNPCDGGQNTKRILKLWTPLIESFNKAAQAAFRKKKAAFRKKNRPMLTALYCSFSKAHQLATSLHDPSQELTLWAAMASVPTSLIHNIAVQAELVFVEHITPQSRPG